MTIFVLLAAYLLAACMIAPLHAQERFFSENRSFEFRLSEVLTLRGSHSVMCEKEGEETLFFEFKPRAYGLAASDVAMVWRGLERQNLKSSILGGASVFAAAKLTDTSAAVFLEKSDTLYLAEIGASLAISRMISLPLQATTGTFTHRSFIGVLGADARSGGSHVKLLSLANGQSLVLAIGTHIFWADLRQNRIADSNNLDTSQSKQIRYLEGSTVSDIVALNPFTTDNNDFACAILREAGLRKEVVMLSPRGEQRWLQSLDVQQRSILRRVSNYTVAVCTGRGSNTYVNIIKQGIEPLSTGIAAKAECIAFAEEQSRILAFAIAGEQSAGNTSENEIGSYVWTVVRLPLNGERSSSENLWRFPETVITPLAVGVAEDEFICIFANSLMVMGFNGEPLAQRRIKRDFSPDWSSQASAGTSLGAGFEANSLEMNVVNNREKNLLIVRLAHLQLFFLKERVPLWWLRNIVRDWWIYAVSLSIVGIVGALLAIVRYQNRLLKTLFAVPKADVMLLLDKENKLTSLNEPARELLGIAVEAPMKRLFEYYCVGAAHRKLYELALLAAKTRRHQQAHITFEQDAPESYDGKEKFDYSFTATPVQTRFGKARGLMLIGRNVTEELGRERLSSWAQLGHDLQTNLTAIRLNAEGINNLQGQRIVYQVALMLQRIKDFAVASLAETVSFEPADAADICIKVCKEFDKGLYPNVQFRIDAQHIIFNCYEQQLIRALRNAVENGIKRGLDDNTGSIEISARFVSDKNEVRFSVHDNGRGMSEEILKKIRTKGFTSAQSKGGTGLGMTIMQYIVRMHEGTMEIDSELGKGTTVHFRLPAKQVRLLTQKPLHLLLGEDP